MSPPASSPVVRPFGDLPVLRRGGRWLLAAGTGTAPVGPALAVELDRFAESMAAAESAVAALHPYPRGRR